MSSSSGEMRARVDHLGRDAVLLEQLGRGERDAHHRARRDDRHVLARALHVGDAERDQELAVGHLALHRVVHLVLDEDDRVVVADRRLQQALRVGRRRRQDDLEARHVRDPRLQRLAVLRGGASRRAERRAQRQRHLQLAARHVVRLRRLVRELVHDEREEVAEHDVDHRPQAGHRRADAEPGDPGLGDRRVEDALGAELLDEAGQHLERVPGLGDVLADDEHGRRRGAALRRAPRSRPARTSACVSPASSRRR